jgi:endonuclease/exonuclease/phosphatase family metal-dependent hydrolase
VSCSGRADIKALHKAVDYAKLQSPSEDDFIVLGDFNASCSYAKPSDFSQHPIATNYVWLIPDDADTNCSSKTCAYDRILVSLNTVSEYLDSWGVRPITSTKVSDHFPVWTKFSILEN